HDASPPGPRALSLHDALPILRMVLAAIQAEEVAGKTQRELSDEDVIKVLARESRRRSEAAEIYTQSGRGELAATEHAEMRVIDRSEEHTSELQSRENLVCRLL